MNRNTFRLASLLSLALGLMGAGPASCGSPDPDLCLGLDEQACLQTDGCAPAYYQPRCLCASCPEGVECPPCSCDAPDFASCSAEQPEPPPADRCAGLEESACMFEPGCAPTYFATEPGVRCASDRCLGDFAGCVEAPDTRSCADLDEAACVANPKCEAFYWGDGGIPGIEVAGCQSSFVGCRDAQQACPALACMLWCENGMARDENGCESCACNTGCSSDADCSPGQRCDVPELICLPDGPCPVPTGLCVPAQNECRTDADCAAGQRCEAGLMDCAEGQDCVGAYGLCVTDQCPPVACLLFCDTGFARDENGCETCQCAPANCMADSDCAAGEVCDATTGTCVATGCQPVVCDLWCEGGFARDERGCEVCACQPAGCSSDADCALGQVCESFATCTAIGCPPPPPSACVERTCQYDSDCAADAVCRPDPMDPCSADGVYCLQPARRICQAPCAGLDEAGCVARVDCSATYVNGGGWCGNEMVFSSCSDR